MIMGNKPT